MNYSQVDSDQTTRITVLDTIRKLSDDFTKHSLELLETQKMIEREPKRIQGLEVGSWEWKYQSYVDDPEAVAVLLNYAKVHLVKRRDKELQRIRIEHKDLIALINQFVQMLEELE